MKKQISIGGVVYCKKDDKIEVVLIKDSYNRWALPKGHMEEGETKEETAKREIKEETGLKNLKVEKEIDLIRYFFRLKGELINKVVYFYLVRADKKEKFKKSWEVKDAKWLEIDSAIGEISYENSKKILKKAKDLICKS